MSVQRIELIRVIRKASDHGLASAMAQADAILESDWLNEQRAEAWDEGHRAPQYHSNLNGDYLGPAKNPYRTEPHE